VLKKKVGNPDMLSVGRLL